MSQFRSEEMNLVQLFVQSDAAHETLHELGKIGSIQFKDVCAPPFHCMSHQASVDSMPLRALTVCHCVRFFVPVRICAGRKVTTLQQGF